MEAFKLWLSKPIRGWRKFVRALELTTQATCSAEAMIAMLDNDWRCSRTTVRTGGGYVDGSQPSPPMEVGDVAIIGSDGEVGELPPDCPEEPMTYGDDGLGSRAALFRRYWVARVHAEYPRVVGNWDEAALAATRLFLCKAMREPREYYVRMRKEEVIGGDGKPHVIDVVHPEQCPDTFSCLQNVSYRKKFKRGMTTMQIERCVDWLVTAAHMGTPAMAAQEALRESMRPNWLMRMCGLTRRRTAW